MNRWLSSGESPFQEEQPPEIANHELLRRVGRGAYGEVWLARSVTGAYRAVKIVRRNSFEHERPFEREFEGIVQFEPISREDWSQVDILHVGREREYFYYVMEVADDQVTGSEIDPENYHPRTLKSDLHVRGRLSFEECLTTGVALAKALECLHEHGLVHRDVKPSNIIFVQAVPKLADIGLVTGVDTTRSFVGTEGFAAPEGPGTVQADIYSLGKVLYEMATGKDRQQFPELPTDLREAPDVQGLVELNAVIARACRHDPNDRYRAVAELRGELELLQTGKSLTKIRRLEKRVRHFRRVAVLILLIAVLAGLGYVLQTKQTAEATRLASENLRLAQTNQLLVGKMQEQLITLHTEGGLARLDAGNSAASLPYLVEALRIKEEVGAGTAIDRLRLGMVVKSFPRLLAAIPAGGSIVWIARSGDGRVFAVATDTGVVTMIEEGAERLRILKQAAGVFRVEFSTDGSLVVSASNDGFARVWDWRGERLIQTLKHEQPVRHASFSPDGKLVVTACEDRFARVWEVRSGRLAGEPLPHEFPVLQAGFSPDGTSIATGSGVIEVDPYAGAVSLWGWPGGKLRKQPVALNAPAGQITFSSDGALLASSCGLASFDRTGDRPGALVDVATGELISMLNHRDRTLHCEFSPDGSRLVTTSISGEAVLREGKTGRALSGTGRAEAGSPWIFQATNPAASGLSGEGTAKHQRWVRHAAFSPDGRMVATCSSDGTTAVWDGFSSKPLAGPMVQDGQVTQVAFDRTGTRLLTGGEDGLVRIWEISSALPEVPAFRHGGQVTWGLFSRDETLAITASRDKTVKAWSTADGGQRWGRTVGGAIRSLAVGSEPAVLFGVSEDGFCHAWEMGTGGQVWEAFRIGERGFAIALSPDEQVLATANIFDGGRAEIQLWEARTGKLLPRRTMVHEQAVFTLDFSSDGRLLVSSSVDGTAVIWESGTGGLKHRLSEHGEWLEGARFSPDGTRVVTHSRDQTARVWEVERGRMVLPPLRHSGLVWTARFDPASARIVTAGDDGTAVQWELETGKAVDPPMRHLKAVKSAFYSADGEFISTASFDGTARVWEAATGRPVSPLLRHGSLVFSARFAKDARSLLTISDDASAQLWKFSAIDWPVRELQWLAEAVSGQRVTAQGGLAKLTPSEISGRVEELRRSRPEWEMGAEELQRWHQREQRDSGVSGDAFGEAFHRRGELEGLVPKFPQKSL